MTTLSQDMSPLRCSNAVAAVIVVDDGTYLLQRRDDIPGIWYPDHWGCFGGAVDAGEDDRTAIKRELFEELSLDCDPQGPVFNMDYDVVGTGSFYRNYYEVRLTTHDVAKAKLGEGQELACFSAADILDRLRMTPYDAFAIYLHMRGKTVSVAL